MPLRPPIVVAHRGASATHPENTIAAFDAAVSAGAEAVELDVRLTGDGYPVVMHDPVVDRMTDGRGAVRSFTLDQIERMRIVHGSAGDQRIPSLAQALEAVSGRVGVVIEVKNLPGEPDFDPDPEPLVRATLTALHRSAFAGPAMLVSFNPMSIDASRRLEPAIPTGLLSADAADLSAALAYAKEHGHVWILPVAVAVHAAGAPAVEEAHRSAVRVGTWVVDEAADAVELMRIGVDAVATNDPAVVLEARRKAFAP